MKVLILAAGYGTRLYSIIKDKPKALLEINSKPLVDHILDRIQDLPDLCEVILVTNDKFYSHFQSWAQDKSSFPHKITVVNDGTTTPENRLGSIGDIQFVIEKGIVEDDLLIVGGDNLFDFNLNEYINFAREKAPAATIGTYDIHDLQGATKFGVVGVDSIGKIVSFEEKPPEPKSTLIAMCFYYLPKESLSLVSVYLTETNKSDKAGDYIRWLQAKNEVYAFTFTGKWYDIGSVESYHDAQENFK